MNSLFQVTTGPTINESWGLVLFWLAFCTVRHIPFSVLFICSYYQWRSMRGWSWSLSTPFLFQKSTITSRTCNSFEMVDKAGRPAELNPSPKITNLSSTGNILDTISKIIFPLSYMLCLITYFSIYLWRHSRYAWPMILEFCINNYYNEIISVMPIGH